MENFIFCVVYIYKIFYLPLIKDNEIVPKMGRK